MSSTLTIPSTRTPAELAIPGYCGDYTGPVLAVRIRHSTRHHHVDQVPVADLTCPFCLHEIPADQIDSAEIGVSRIGGDSANGYEAYHVECVNYTTCRGCGYERLVLEPCGEPCV